MHGLLHSSVPLKRYEELFLRKRRFFRDENGIGAIRRLKQKQCLWPALSQTGLRAISRGLASEKGRFR